MRKWIKIGSVVVFILLIATFFLLKHFGDDEEEHIFRNEHDKFALERMKEQQEEMTEEDKEIIEFSENIISYSFEDLEKTEKKISKKDIASGNDFEYLLDQEPVVFEPVLPEHWNESLADKIEGYMDMETNHERIKELDNIYEDWFNKHSIPKEVIQEIEELHVKLNILSKDNDYNNSLYYFTEEARNMFGPIYGNLINDENMYDEYVLTYFEYYDKEKELVQALNFKESLWKENGEVLDRQINHYVTIYKKEDGEWKVHFEIPVLTKKQQEVYGILGY